MPGGEDQFDRFHVLSPEFSGKTKTDRFNPRTIGDKKRPGQLHLPVESDPAANRGGEGAAVVVDGSGSQPAGLYFNNPASGSFERVQTATGGTAVAPFLVEDTDGTDRFRVNDGGPTEVVAGDLRLPTGSALEDGTGAERVTVNSADTELRAGSGVVSLPSDDLQLPTGGEIQDGAGTPRVGLRSIDTQVLDEAGRVGFEMSNGFANALRAYSDQPFRVRDREGSFKAIEYQTAASAPGDLELTNADLITAGRSIRPRPDTGREYTPAGADIPDDSVATFNTAGRNLGIIVAIGVYGVFACTFDSLDIFHASNEINDADSSEPLGGTTGPDGNLNLANNDNTLEVENRTGEEKDVAIYFYG
jgi:hypothetical protein